MRPGFLLLILLIPIAVAASCSSGGGGVISDCGDGEVTGSEECDDSNNTSCDGCSANCSIEQGPVCGDGVVSQACGEECDDGNNVPGDGCDGSCQSELCGNGNLDPGEECDDGNTGRNAIW